MITILFLVYIYFCILVLIGGFAWRYVVSDFGGSDDVSSIRLIVISIGWPLFFGYHFYKLWSMTE